jgi:hypothetical protein
MVNSELKKQQAQLKKYEELYIYINEFVLYFLHYTVFLE